MPNKISILSRIRTLIQSIFLFVLAFVFFCSSFFNFASAATEDCLLKSGAKGHAVNELQQALLDACVFPEQCADLVVNGTYDKATVNAVTQYQTDAKLKVDGQAGTETFKSLNLTLTSSEGCIKYTPPAASPSSTGAPSTDSTGKTPGTGASVNSNCSGFYKAFEFKDGAGKTQNTVEGLPQICSASSLIQKAIDIALAIAGSIAVMFLIIGGFWYLTSAGSEEQAEKGKKTLINSVIGLAVIILSFAIVRIVVNLFTSNTSNSTSGNTVNSSASTNPAPVQHYFTPGGPGDPNYTPPGSISSSGAPTVQINQRYTLTLTIPKSLMTCGGDASNVFLKILLADGQNQSDPLPPYDFSEEGNNYKAVFLTNLPSNYGFIITGNETSRSDKQLKMSTYLCESGTSSYDTSADIQGVPLENGVSPRGGGPGDASVTDAKKQAAADNSTFSLALINGKKTIKIDINAQNSDKMAMCGEGVPSKLVNDPLQVYVNGQLATLTREGTAADSFEEVSYTSAITSNKSVRLSICGYTIGGGEKSISP